MKINWKMFKVLLAFVVIIGTALWAVNSVRSHSYSGANLSFDVGGGSVSVTNPSDQPIPVQLVGAGSRSFKVASKIEGISGSSTRQEVDGARTYLFEFDLPSGTTEFTVTGDTDVSFVSNSTTRLRATVDPLSDDDLRTTVIGTVIVILGALFYASNATQHQWIGMLRRQISGKQEAPKTQPTPVVPSGGQGRAARSYGDNRADIGD